MPGSRKSPAGNVPVGYRRRPEFAYLLQVLRMTVHGLLLSLDLRQRQRCYHAPTRWLGLGLGCPRLQILLPTAHQSARTRRLGMVLAHFWERGRGKPTSKSVVQLHIHDRMPIVDGLELHATWLRQNAILVAGQKAP